MIINLKRVPKIIEEKKSNPAIKAPASEKGPSRLSIQSDWVKTIHAKPGQLNPLWQEFDKVKTERAHVSNKLFDLINRGATEEELKVLVHSIKDFQPRLENLFDQARHVDQYGALPKIAEVKRAESSSETWLLKDMKRKLIDKRSKLLKKINAGSEWRLTTDEQTGELSMDEKKKPLPKKEKKLMEWQAELDQVIYHMHAARYIFSLIAAFFIPKHFRNKSSKKRAF